MGAVQRILDFNHKRVYMIQSKVHMNTTRIMTGN